MNPRAYKLARNRRSEVRNVSQVVGLPRVGGLSHRYVWREAA